MEIPTVLRSVAFDLRQIPVGTASLRFFGERSEGASSCLNASEGELVEWIASESPARDLLFKQLGLRGSVYVGSHVEEPFVKDRSKKPGDIDLLLCEVASPHEAVALECKRVKLAPCDAEGVKITKLRAAVHGIPQANALVEIGFHRSYLLFMLVTDGRRIDGVHFLSRGAAGAAYHRVFEFDEWTRLREQIGLLFLEITQPVDAPIAMSGSLAIGRAKDATPCLQTSAMTERVRRYLRSCTPQ